MSHSFQLLDITETENRNEVGWFFRREGDKIDEADQAGTPILFDYDRWGQCTEAIVVRKAGKIIGIVTLAPDGIDNSKRPTIDTLYVQEQHRKKGLGYSLFEQGIRRLIECIGNKTIYCDFQSSYMMPLYEKLPLNLKKHLRYNEAFRFGDLADEF